MAYFFFARKQEWQQRSNQDARCIDKEMHTLVTFYISCNDEQDVSL